MSPFLAVWAGGFLALSLPVFLDGASEDPADHWPPASLFLLALWPLLLVLGLALWGLLAVMDWYYAPEDRR